MSNIPIYFQDDGVPPPVIPPVEPPPVGGGSDTGSQGGATPLPTRPGEPSYTIRIRHPQTLQLVCELDSYASMRYVRRFQTSGEFELVVGNEHPRILEIIRENGVVEVLRNGGHEFAGRILYRQAKVDEGAEGTSVWSLKGPCLSGAVRRMRILPTAGQEFDTQTALSAATAMRHYLDLNGGLGSLTARQVPGLEVGNCYVTSPQPTWYSLSWYDANPDERAARGWGSFYDQKYALTTASALGSAVTWQARYDRMIDLQSAIALVGDVGFRFRMNADLGKVYFDVLAGGDRTQGTASGLSPAIFSVNRDSLRSGEYEDNGLEVVNVVYAGGAGDGIRRQIIEVGDQDSIDRWGRCEEFVDFREATTTAALTSAANKYLAEHSNAETISFQPLENDALLYGYGWDIGDLVTVTLDPLGVSSNLRISEIAVSLTPGQAADLTITTGRYKTSIVRHLRRRESETSASRIANYYIAPMITPPTTSATITTPTVTTSATAADQASVQTAVNNITALLNAIATEHASTVTKLRLSKIFAT